MEQQELNARKAQILQIDATDNQLSAMMNRILLGGTIIEMRKPHGFVITQVSYEGRLIEISQNIVAGKLVTLFIDDKTLGQNFTRNLLYNAS